MKALYAEHEKVQWLRHARYEKPLKNHPLEVAKKCVEKYSPSNAAAPDPEEGVQRQKKIPFRHIHIL